MIGRARHDLWIGGKKVPPTEGHFFPTVNPATEEVLGLIPSASPDDIDAAVAASQESLDRSDWRDMHPAALGKLLHRIGDLILAYREELARLECQDAGKPYREALRGDVPAAAASFHYFAGLPTKILGESFPSDGRHLRFTLREPVGVVASIISWNFPLLMAAWKLAPALATGNSVILKPAEQTPLSALRLAEICAEAGLPEGVLSVLSGLGHTTGAALVRHPGIHKVAFTGSTSVGREIRRVSAENLTPVTLELGGKSPQIIFADADLDRAIKAASRGIFYNCGAICTAGSRLLVQEAVYDRVLEGVLEAARTLQPGDPTDPKCRLGPLISNEHRQKVLASIEQGKAGGAELLAGGDCPDRAGFFLNPTVFGLQDNSSVIAREEIFGPVLGVQAFSDRDHAIQLANDSRYGLAAGVWTRDTRCAHAMVRRLQAGTVWVNTYNAFDAMVPFGGYKHSGLGRELSHHAVEHYTQLKSVWMGY